MHFPRYRSPVWQYLAQVSPPRPALPQGKPGETRKKERERERGGEPVAREWLLHGQTGRHLHLLPVDANGSPSPLT